MGRKFRSYTLRRINARKNQCKKSLNCVWVNHCKRKRSGEGFPWIVKQKKNRKKV